MHAFCRFTGHAEYKELDQKLDALDQALDMLERRRDKIHEEAQQLLVDARAARFQAQNEKELMNGESKEDSASNGDNSNSDSTE